MATMAELLADTKRNAEDIKHMFDPAGQHLRDAVWPFLESMVESMNEALAELDGRIDEVESGEAELLYAETGDKILGALAMAAEFAVELQRRIGDKPNDIDKKWVAKIVAFGKVTQELVPYIEGITLEEVDEDEDEDDEDDDDEDTGGGK